MTEGQFSEITRKHQDKFHSQLFIYAVSIGTLTVVVMDYTIKQKIWIPVLISFSSLCLIMHYTIQLLDAFRQTAQLTDCQDAIKKNDGIVKIENLKCKIVSKLSQLIH